MHTQYKPMKMLERALAARVPEGVTELQVNRQEAHPGFVVSFVRLGEQLHGEVRLEALLKAIESNLLEVLADDFWDRPVMEES